MKKKIIFSFLIICFIFNVLMFINIFTSNRKIVIQDVASYTSKMNTIRENIDKIDDKECNKAFNNMVKRINNTHFTKEVSIKKYYQVYFKDNKTFMDYYNDVMNSCNIDYDENLYSDVIASLMYPYKIREEYLLRYEYIFKDKSNRKKLDKFNDELGTFSTKHLEISVLERLINGVSDEKDL